MAMFALALLQACNAMKGQSDMENMLRLMEADDPADFEAVMLSFIAHAKSQNLEQMLALTSDVTIKNVGIEQLTQHYLNDTIPALKACKSISAGGDVIHVSKAESGTGPGWVFRKTCSYGEDKTISVRFVVLRENGRVVLTSFGLG